MTLLANQFLRGLALTALLDGVLAAGQDPSPTQSPSTTSGNGQTASAGSQAVAPGSKTDKTFVKKAIQGGNAEVQLGQLASQKANSQDVKEFGQKMVTDHTRLGDQLKPIAQQLNLPAPTGTSAKDKALYTKLNSMSGPEFDSEYIRAMVKDHQDDLKEFRKEATSTQNPDLKQAVQQGASVISQHLQTIEQIAQKHNVSVGGKPTETSSNQ